MLNLIYKTVAVTVDGTESQWLDVERKNLYVRSKDLATNIERQDWAHCFICNKKVNGMTGANYVHIADDLIVPTNVRVSEAQGSQGCFPVGNDCCKKLPAGYTRFVNYNEA